jgi:hypothetical protein
MTAERVRIVLELDPAADPIAGSLTGPRAPARSFSGWIALGRALEQEIAQAREVAGDPVGAEPAPSRIAAGLDPTTNHGSAFPPPR